jgi:hypothetical protein
VWNDENVGCSHKNKFAPYISKWEGLNGVEDTSSFFFFGNKGFPSLVRSGRSGPEDMVSGQKIQPIKKMVWATEYCFVGPGLIKILAIPSLSRPGKSR